MIVRMWHGRVPASRADGYRAVLNVRALPDYRSIAGNISVPILERPCADLQGCAPFRHGAQGATRPRTGPSPPEQRPQ